jgi:peptide/nickel transport system ATP-binding protein
VIKDSLREMIELQEKLHMSMIYISHDIAVIAEVTDRIGVMYAGRMAEFGSAVEIFKHPLHPYSYGLMSAFPSIVGPKRELTTLPGEPPDLIAPPSGCCSTLPLRRKSALSAESKDMGGEHFVACWHPMEGTDVS